MFDLPVRKGDLLKKVVMKKDRILLLLKGNSNLYLPEKVREKALRHS